LVDLQERDATLHEGLTPLEARALNLLAVTTALTKAGIEHFVVRSREDRSSSVAVREGDREAVITVIGRAMEQPRGYVQCLVPAGTGRNPILPGNSRRTWPRMGRAKVIRCIWFRSEPSMSLVYGAEYGCDIEFWTEEEDGALRAPRPNRCSALVRPTEWVDVDPSSMTPLGINAPEYGQTVRSLADFAISLPEDIRFPIDLVYTWVDGTDPVWAAKKASTLGQSYHAEASSAARYLSRNELRYSIRSVFLFAPWVRTIFIVTDDQTPPWLSAFGDRVRVVSHKEIFSDSTCLPTYKSHAIESQLHHIDGLSEHFLYLNDDMFFGRPVTPNAFFLSNGIAKYFPSQSRVPQGPITESDTPVDAACKNNRALLQEQFGPVIAQSMQHVPYALRRSVLQEIEDSFPEAYRVTASSSVRSQTDHSFTSSLHQYYSFLTGRGIAGNVRYTYIQLAVQDLAARLDRLLVRRDRDTFCLNDAYSTPEQLAAQTDLLTGFLERYFPVASPYEKDEPTA
jgi:hypothetical protein